MNPATNHSQQPLHILLLCHFEPGSASTIIEHIQAFTRFSRNRFYVLSNLGDLPWWLDLERFDGIIVHYSLIACYDNYVSPEARRRIRDFRGFKAAFVQDDYRWINDTVDALAYMRINALFPLVGPEIMDEVYSPARLPGVRRETVLTGYVPVGLTHLPVRPIAERPIDVGYRARKLPAWIGSHTLQKWQIADRFLADAPRFGLAVDISYREEDRIYGESWVRFVSNCKAVLGTESGASVCDFTGDIQRHVEAHVKRDPEATFEELRELYFKSEDCRIMMNVISPRCFEAAALRTLMILYEGWYSGILQPYRHYVPLKTDHSNMDEVVRILRDSEQAQQIVDRAYREIALNHAYTFQALIERVDRVIAEEYRPVRLAAGYSDEEFAWRLNRAQQDVTRYATLRSAPGGDAAEHLRLLSREPEKAPLSSDARVAPPHELRLHLAPAMRVHTLHLVWEQATYCASSITVTCVRRSRTVSESRFQVDTPRQYLRLEITGGRSCDAVLIRFDAYLEGSMMRLQDLTVDAPLPVLERLRLFRQRAGQAVLYSVGHFWMKLPAPVRAILKRPVRFVYDSLFARRG